MSHLVQINGTNQPIDVADLARIGTAKQLQAAALSSMPWGTRGEMGKEVGMSRQAASNARRRLREKIAKASLPQPSKE